MNVDADAAAGPTAATTAAEVGREALPVSPNPLGLEGIEFVEYATPRPQALGHVLETLGFRPVARHRSREVLLYRQGAMNIVVNAHGLPPAATPEDHAPRIVAIALRVRDAAAAYRCVVELGAWPVAVHVQPMELHIPGVHGVGASHLYFVDRWREFSIYDVDFVPIPTVEPVVPALAGLHWFGVVQYVGAARAADWSAFYGDLFGFRPLAPGQSFGILPSGRVLRSPCGSFFLQLIEPAPGGDDTFSSERLQRVAFGVPDVTAAVQALRARGVEFVEDRVLHSSERGALTRTWLGDPADSASGTGGGVCFELVHHAA